MEVARANGLEIAYERVGEGPPLVFVHGAAVDCRMWRPQLAALGDEFTVVAWDEPGAGRSSDVPAHFTLADYAHCLAALVDALDLGPAHVGGLSWGGTVALELYRHHPELVATLILADTYAGWKGSLPAEEVRARVEGVRQMLAAADHLFDPTLPGLFAGDPPAEFVALLDAMAADIRPQSMRTALLIMAEADQRDVLARIAVPTLLINTVLKAPRNAALARCRSPAPARLPPARQDDRQRRRRHPPSHPRCLDHAPLPRPTDAHRRKPASTLSVPNAVQRGSEGAPPPSANATTCLPLPLRSRMSSAWLLSPSSPTTRRASSCWRTWSSSKESLSRERCARGSATSTSSTAG